METAIPPARRLRRWRRVIAPALLPLLVMSLVLLSGLLVLGLSVPGLRSDLEQARRQLIFAQQALAAGDTEGARRSLSAAQSAAAEAHAAAHGPLWRMYGLLPGFSAVTDEVQAVTSAVRTTADEVLAPLLAADLQPGVWQGGVDPAPFVAARAPVRRAEAALAQARTTLDAAPRSRLSPIENARAELDGKLRELATTLLETRIAADVVPALTGAEGERRYFLAVQNPAEARATGGLIGAYGILRAAGGRLTLDRSGANDELIDRSAPVLDLGADFERRYGRFEALRTWRSANLTPHVPDVGALVTALWRDQTGERLDGALLVDPVALSMLLRATGPVTLPDGTVLDEAGVVPLLLSEVYVRFPRARDAERNVYLQDATRAVVEALGSPQTDGAQLVEQVGRAVATGHLQLWSADPALQAVLAPSLVAGILAETGPFLSVVSQDAGGSKLDYYARKSVAYRSTPTGEEVDLGSGPEPEEEAVVEVQLENTAPAQGLPSYVTLRADDPGQAPPVGQRRSWVSIYLGARATLLEATLDGVPLLMESGTEQGLAVFSAYVDIDSQAVRSLVLRVRQPARPGQALVYRQQPGLVDDVLQVVRQGTDSGVELRYASLAPNS